MIYLAFIAFVLLVCAGCWIWRDAPMSDDPIDALFARDAEQRANHTARRGGAL